MTAESPLQLADLDGLYLESMVTYIIDPYTFQSTTTALAFPVLVTLEQFDTKCGMELIEDKDKVNPDMYCSGSSLRDQRNDRRTLANQR